MKKRTILRSGFLVLLIVIVLMISTVTAQDADLSDTNQQEIQQTTQENTQRVPILFRTDVLVTLLILIAIVNIILALSCIHFMNKYKYLKRRFIKQREVNKDLSDKLWSAPDEGDMLGQWQTDEIAVYPNIQSE